MRSRLTADETRARSRAWYHRNLESQRQRSRIKLAKAYRLNRKVILERNRNWAKKNSERVKVRQKQYCLENADKRKAQQKEWRSRNGKAWRQKNLKDHPNRDILQAHKRRALKRAATVNLSQIKEWMDAVKSKPFLVCYYCNNRVSTKEIHFDHIIALSKGGAHSVENLCVSCAPCNLSKNNKAIGAWIRVGQQILAL